MIRNRSSFSAHIRCSVLLVLVALGAGLLPAQTVPPVSTLDLSQNPFQGGIPSGQVTPEVLDLSLLDALDRGLKFNLGLIVSERGSDQARAARLKALSELLPNVNARVTEQVEQINLAALGVPASFLRGMSPIAGPFSIFDARGRASETISLHAIQALQAAQESVLASQHNVRNARDLVVLYVGGGYIRALSAQAHIAAIQAQLETAESLFRQAQDMKQAGVIAAIDVLRAQVEMQAQQQRLLAAQNELAKDKLALSRAIGLPLAQQIRLTTEAPYRPSSTLTLEASLDQALRARADYQALLAQEKAAELSYRAATAERLPSIQLYTDYGVLGLTPGHSHGTFTTAAALEIPIFQGGKIRADEQAAQAVWEQRRAQTRDARVRVEFEVRASFLDLNSAAQEVEVARGTITLANDTLRQARDRFAAGVTNNIEVIQAQESLALSNENYIASLLAHNLAKLSLARSLGEAETAVKQYLGGTP